MPKSAETSVINFATKISPVVHLDQAVAREKLVASRRRAHPDRKLIEACVDYAAFIVGGEAGFKVDPTDSEFASIADDIARSRADRELTAAARQRPSTMDGLRAKAAIARIILERSGNFSPSLEELEFKFLHSLADDVIRFHRASMDQQQSRDKILEPRR